jgi:3-hydroxy-D-aspartate aldolase
MPGTRRRRSIPACRCRSAARAPIYTKPSDEHGVLTGDPIALPHRGDRLLLVPGHCDPTVNLHDFYVCVRGLHGPDAHVEALWPVAGRGALT